MAKISRLLAITALFCTTISLNCQAADTAEALSVLKQGGYVIVFRHVATDEGQKDVYPLKFDDMSAQRQLSEEGREIATQIGNALQTLNVPIGEIYTSKLNRAVETGKLISGKDVIAMDELTDSGAGNPSAMARPGGGGNVELGRALQQLANTSPKPGKNTLIITHKTNIADAFGKDWNEVKEGEATVFRPDSSDSSSGPALLARIQAAELIDFGARDTKADLSPETHCLDEATNQPRPKIVSSEGGDISTSTGTSKIQLDERASKNGPTTTASSLFTRPAVSPAALPMC
jgi:hypothetical protein